jgi:hypothetical protein
MAYHQNVKCQTFHRNAKHQTHKTPNHIPSVGLAVPNVKTKHGIPTKCKMPNIPHTPTRVMTFGGTKPTKIHRAKHQNETWHTIKM